MSVPVQHRFSKKTMINIPSFIQTVNTLKHIPVFSGLGWLDLQRIARKSVLSTYKKGDIIRREGDPPDYFYCLISGRLQAYSFDDRGQKDNVDFIHRGVYFGIISLMTGENHSMNFEALNDSVVLKIGKEDWHELLKTIPQLAVEFSHELSKRMRRKVKGKAAFESKIISVYSAMKGSGSSTYAINLAVSLKEETDKNVIFISINPSTHQRPSGEPLCEAGLKWKSSPVSLRKLAKEEPQQVQEAIIKNDLNVDLMNVCFDPKDEEAKDLIVPFVSNLIGDYHYVIVDLPNEMDDVVLKTLIQSDLVHLITYIKKNDLDLVKRVIDRLEVNLKQNFKEEKIRVIVRADKERTYLSFEQINKFIDYHVYSLLPIIDDTGFEKEVHCESFSFLGCKKRSNYNRVVKRISREIGGVLVGLVLGGGAALGIAHIGVIKVMEEEDIPIDIVSGSSMGALVGSLWVTGKNSCEMAKIAMQFKKKINMLKLVDWFVLPISGFVSGHAIKRWLKKYLGAITFYSTRVPFKVIAYDLVKRQELVIDGGPLIDAVRQSISIPGVFMPIRKGEQVIIDGGVMNPLPTNIMVKNGIKKIIAVNVLQSPEDMTKSFELSQKRIKEQLAVPFRKGPFAYIGLRLSRFFVKLFRPNVADIIVFTLQAAEYVIAKQSAEQADVNIHPDAYAINWYELYKVEELIKAGEDAARKALPQIRALIAK